MAIKNWKPDPKPVKREKKGKKATGELGLFLQLWQDRPHVSFLSGIPLDEFDVSCFLHVLAKGQNKYPKFKLYPKNIVFGTPLEHFLYDNGTMDSRARYKMELMDMGYDCDWEKIWKLRDTLKEKYKKL